MSDRDERAIAKAVETLTEHGWRWGDPELGESPKSLVPGFRKVEHYQRRTQLHLCV